VAAGTLRVTFACGAAVLALDSSSQRSGGCDGGFATHTSPRGHGGTSACTAVDSRACGAETRAVVTHGVRTWIAASPRHRGCPPALFSPSLYPLCPQRTRCSLTNVRSRCRDQTHSPSSWFALSKVNRARPCRTIRLHERQHDSSAAAAAQLGSRSSRKSSACNISTQRLHREPASDSPAHVVFPADMDLMPREVCETILLNLIDHEHNHAALLSQASLLPFLCCDSCSELCCITPELALRLCSDSSKDLCNCDVHCATRSIVCFGQATIKCFRSFIHGLEMFQHSCDISSTSAELQYAPLVTALDAP